MSQMILTIFVTGLGLAGSHCLSQELRGTEVVPVVVKRGGDGGADITVTITVMF